MSQDTGQEPTVENSAVQFRVIGSQPTAQDAPDTAAGRAEFAIDVRLPRMAHAKILRSPHAHARIRSIDTSRAEALPGVFAVVTWKDLWTSEEMACPNKVNPNRKHFRTLPGQRQSSLLRSPHRGVGSNRSVACRGGREADRRDA
jgi:CO/xanthine dehydrogenase Mo-binding subunit